MATDRMLHEETGSPALLAQLEGEYELDLSLGDMDFPSNPLHWMAGALLVDKIAGVAREDDRLVMNSFLTTPLLAFATIEGAEAVQHMAQYERRLLMDDAFEFDLNGQAEADVMDAGLAEGAQWFTLRFTEDLTIDGELYAVPESIKDRSLTIRFLSDEELDRMPDPSDDGDVPYDKSFEWFATVRADGTPVDASLQYLGTF